MLPAIPFLLYTNTSNGEPRERSTHHNHHFQTLTLSSTRLPLSLTAMPGTNTNELTFQATYCISGRKCLTFKRSLAATATRMQCIQIAGVYGHILGRLLSHFSHGTINMSKVVGRHKRQLHTEERYKCGLKRCTCGATQQFA